MNQIILIGRTVKDAELSVLNNANKTNVMKFTLAVERDYKDKEGKKPVDFINVELMGKDLAKLTSFVTKGKQVAVNGSLNIDKVNDTYFTKVKASKIELLGGNNSNGEAPKTEKEPKQNEFSTFEQIDDEDIPF